MAYFTSCDNNSGIWAFDPGHSALEIESQIGRILLEPNGTVDTKVSMELLRFALTQKSFHGIEVT